MKYRKRPVVIEAVLWDGHAKTVTPFAPFENAIESIHVKEDGTLDIPTLEGTMTAQLGDFIIKGVKGEIYPCKPDVFAQTYEIAE